MELREPLAVLASHIVPAFLPYGVASVEVSYEAGDAAKILGIQFRDPKGLRIGRGTVPATMVAALEGWVVAYVATVGTGSREGVLELCLGDRKVVHKQTRYGDDDFSISEWVW